jgi:hypothetical protein
MGITQPFAWTAVEDALHGWVTASTGLPGDDVRFQTRRAEGGARGPAPRALIQLLSLVPISMPTSDKWPQVKAVRVTVTAGGAGLVGVDFYPGRSDQAQQIAVATVPADTTETAAAKLLVELVANLPAGYLAAPDPADTSSVLVGGTEAEPLFALADAAGSLTSSATTVPRFPLFVSTIHTATWRITFRSPEVSGPSHAACFSLLCMNTRRVALDRPMGAVGFISAGIPGTTVAVPPERDESVATIDIAYRGLLTGAVAATAMRQASVTLIPQAA